MTTTPSDTTTIDTTPSTGIIDFRARPNTHEYMADLLVPNYPLWTQFRTDPPPVESLDTFIQALGANSIDRGVFTGRQRIEHGRLTFGVTNDYVAQCVAQHPDVLIGVASVDPSTGPVELARELDHSIAELGLKGIALDFHWLKVPVSDPVFSPIYTYAQEKGVPVILTVGGLNGPLGHPDRIAEVAEAFPDLTIVASHGMWPYVNEYVRLAWRYPNVIIEASMFWFYPGVEPFIEAAGDLISDQVVYASAFPYQPLETLHRFRELAIPEDALTKILWDNPRRILGL